MTEHYFEHQLAKLHYYRFGTGPKAMLCFHGYGMHGKQFKVLEEKLGNTYTFYGFDLFFHQQTKLTKQDVEEVSRGIEKEEVLHLFMAFCDEQGIDKFSVIGYSMGTHYASVLAELSPDRLEDFILIAPSSIRPVPLMAFLCLNPVGNWFFRKLALSENGLLRLLRFCRKLKIVDDTGYTILYNEIATPDLRFCFYASGTYMRKLKGDEQKLMAVLNQLHVRSAFVFGARDLMYPPKIAKLLLPKLNHAHEVVLNETHELVNVRLADCLAQLFI